jgi:hypothetical protein
VKYKEGAVFVTDAVVAGKYAVELDPGERRLLTVNVRSSPSALRGSVKPFFVTGTSTIEPLVSDVVSARLRIT